MFFFIPNKLFESNKGVFGVPLLVIQPDQNYTLDEGSNYSTKEYYSDQKL
jgi:hypothetical protein